MKVYKLKTFSKYLHMLGDFVVDCTLLIIIPSAFFPLQIGIDMILLFMILLVIIYCTVDRTYYPFFVELYKDKIHIRHRKELSFRPFFMAKFVDISIDFKDIVSINAKKDRGYGDIYFYLQDGKYFSFSSFNSSTVFKIYQDLEQALKEYRGNDKLDKSQL